MRTHKLLHLTLLPVVALALQSCFTAKTYVRPDVVDESAYRLDMHAPATDSSTLAALPWQEMFTDPYLRDYIAEGLQNNIDIRIALQRIDAAEAYYRSGKASRLPMLNVNGQAAYQLPSGNGPNSGLSGELVSQYTLQGTLSWEVDIWGKLRSRERAALSSYLQSQAAHQAVQTSIISGIANLYYQLLAIDEQIKVTELSIANRTKSIETTIALKNAGYITQAGVEQTKAQLYSAQNLLVNLQLNKKLLENTFALLLGWAPQEIDRSRLDEQRIEQDFATGYPVQLLSNRPDVMAAEYGLINAFELTNVARASLYPGLNISAGGGLQSLEFDKFFSASSLFASALGSITQPIFNGRQLRAQYEVAQTQEEIAYLNFKRAVLTASREVSDAMHSLGAANESIEILRRQYEAFEAAAAYSEELLNNGMVNYLEVLTARENALNAQLNLINTRFAQLSAKVELYRALGGGRF